MRLNAAVQRYLRARRHELAPLTRRQLAINLNLAVRHIGGELLVRNLRRSHVEAWLSDMDAAPATIRVRLSAMRTFCRWCIAHGHLKADPTLEVKGPRQPIVMPRELDEEAVVKAFLAAPDPRAELILLLGVQEGLRIGEIAALRREDVDLDGRLMLVNGKGSRQRWLPISEDTFDAIATYVARYPGRTGPMIRSMIHPQRGVTGQYLSVLVGRWFYAAGIKGHAYDGVSAHALRHTMAGVMLDEGADIREVQNALGHASLGPTWGYVKRRSGATQLRRVMGKKSYR
jgi:integrase/recombinase XerC